MADKTPDQLTTVTSIAGTDLAMVYPTGGPLSSIAWTNVVVQLQTDLAPTFLKSLNNLSDLNSPGVARTNLGLGTVATLNTGTSSGNVPVLGSGGKLALAVLFGGYLAKTADYTVTSADNFKLIDVTANSVTITLPAASSVGETFFVEIRNSGAGTVTVSPASGTVDGLSSTTIGPGGTKSFFNNATNYFSVGASSTPGVLHAQLQKSSGTDSGESVPAGSWGTRLFNTSVKNTIVGASLNITTGEITLPAGTYKIRSVCPSSVGLTTASLRARVYDSTHTTALLQGPNAKMNQASTGGTNVSRVDPEVQGYFTLTAQAVIKIQTYGTTAVSPVGTGYGVVSSGENEVFNDVLIEQML